MGYRDGLQLNPISRYIAHPRVPARRRDVIMCYRVSAQGESGENTRRSLSNRIASESRQRKRHRGARLARRSRKCNGLPISLRIRTIVQICPSLRRRISRHGRTRLSLQVQVQGSRLKFSRARFQNRARARALLAKRGRLSRYIA